MKKHSILPKIILLTIIVLIGFSSRKEVNASSELKVTALNEKNTTIANKYGITGTILKIRKDAKSTVILTMDGIYYISSGKVKKYSVGTLSNTSSFYRYGQDIYISPILQKDSKNNTSYVEIKLNLDNGSKKVTANYSSYLGRASEVIYTYMDAYQNTWFTAYQGGSEKYYELYRMDTAGNVRMVASSDDNAYDAFEAYSNMTSDSNQNVYYTYTGGSYKGNETYIDVDGKSYKSVSIIYKADKNLKTKRYEVYGTIDDYKIGPSGDIWVLSGNKTLIHLDKNGKKLARLSLTNGKAIYIVESGPVYVLDDNKVKLVYQNKLYTRVTLNSAYRFHELSMITKDDLIAYNENTFETVKNSSKEIIVSDSYVKTKPYLVKDNKGNLTIFSKNPSTQKDKNTKVYRIGSSGTLFKDFYTNLGDYEKAVGYDNNIYIPYTDNNYNLTINILRSDLKLEKFITFNLVFGTVTDMQVDSKKNLYIVTDQSPMSFS